MPTAELIVLERRRDYLRTRIAAAHRAGKIPAAKDVAALAVVRLEIRNMTDRLYVESLRAEADKTEQKIQERKTK
jgi:hypothetical protein